jgi:hypothetical protein
MLLFEPVAFDVGFGLSDLENVLSATVSPSDVTNSCVMI